MAPQQQQQQRAPEDSEDGSLREPLLESEQTENHQENNPALVHFHSIARQNRRYVLLYTSFAFAGRSIWSQSVLATLVYLLKHDPEFVGFLTATMGVCQLLASIPSGYFSDKHSKSRNLHVASGIGIIAVILTIVSCTLWQTYSVLVMALASWGLCFGTANTTLTALFADSIPDGQRSHWFTKRSILLTLCNASGPLLSLLMFWYLGDHWTICDCRYVLLLGQVVALPSLLVLCCFRDLPTIPNDDPPPRELQWEAPPEPDNDAASNASTDMTGPLFVPTTDVESVSQADTIFHESESSATIQEEEEGDQPPTVWCGGCGLSKHRVIPVLLASADLISGLGSGMSVRYFPLFFVDNLRLRPVQVQIIYILFPIAQALLMRCSQKLAVIYGRCHVTVAFKWTGIFFMLAMLGTYRCGAPSLVVCGIFVLRTGFMNSCGALTRSMLMDNVPSHERGKWSILESVNMFSWSGSAALGGMLVGWFGIVELFAITAAIQLVSSLVVLSLFGVDSKEERRLIWHTQLCCSSALMSET